MHIGIFGAGSVGAYVGGMLVRGGHQVTMIDLWSEHVAHMKQHGLSLSGSQGKFHVPVHALHLSEAQALLNNKVDVAILCVKSYDTEWMTLFLRDYLSSDGYVLSMQNGMNEEAIAHLVGWGRVVGCVLNTIGVEMTGPGQVMRWMKPAPPGYPVFRIGEMHGRVTPRALQIAEVLKSCDHADVTTNLWGERWSKLTNNATASAIGPLTGMGIVEMFAHRDTRRLSIKLAQEGVLVGHAMGLQLEKISSIAPEVWLAGNPNVPDGFAQIEKELKKWEERLDVTGQASTLHDIRRGRRTEIDSINGLIAQKAHELGVAAPLHTTLTARVKQLEAGELIQGIDTIKDLFD
ncbi:ApbA Ketopantoate reductase [Burkholderiaceae bacterium]|jgi:2-dehydropantoate 2-reductase